MMVEGGCAVFGSSKIHVNMDWKMSVFSNFMGDWKMLCQKKRCHVYILLIYMAVFFLATHNYHVNIVLTLYIKESSRNSHSKGNLRSME